MNEKEKIVLFNVYLLLGGGPDLRSFLERTFTTPRCTAHETQ